MRFSVAGQEVCMKIKPGYFMDELHIAVEMLEKLRPKAWKRIVPSLVIIGMVYIQFYTLPLAFKITTKEIMISTVGLATLVLCMVRLLFFCKDLS
jgi:TRAP-type C4-dicarboxylate transport system permease small subunit